LVAISSKALKILEDLFPNRLLTGSEALPYGVDASQLCFRPQAVVLPETKEEVLEILRLADLYQFPIVSRGSGTATTGSSLPIEGGLVVSFTRMNRILEVNPEERIVVVEPGVLNGDLKEYLKKYGLFYPPDPASYAFSTIGGNVATGAGGPRGLKYGTTKDYVLSLLVGLPGGNSFKTGPTTLKGVVSYNLTPLFVGSEGTLGVFLEIYLKVIPLPPQRTLFLLYLPKEEEGLSLIGEILLQGLTPASAEFVDKTSLVAIRENLEGLPASTEALLFLELDGKETEVREDAQFLEKFLKAKGYSFEKAEMEEEIEQLWEIRRIIAPSLKKLGPKKIADDVVVPRKKMREFLKFLREWEKESGIYIAAFGHVGDGNFHVNLLFEEEKKDVAQKVRESVLKKVLELYGTISGEHGIGYTKRPYVAWELNPLQLEIMKKLKAIFDPKGLLNPHIKWP